MKGVSTRFYHFHYRGTPCVSNPLAVVSIERPTHLVEPAGEFGVITGSGKMCEFSERGNLVVLIEPFKKSEDAYRSIGIQT